jgi:hypothetical protein
MPLHIVVIGDPIDGFSFVGPFKTGDDAFAWARKHLAPRDVDWWFTPLEPQRKWEKHSE